MTTFALSYIDADRMNKPSPGNGKRVPLRVRFAVAFVIIFAAWLFLRVNHYFMR